MGSPKAAAGPPQIGFTASGVETVATSAARLGRAGLGRDGREALGGTAEGDGFFGFDGVLGSGFGDVLVGYDGVNRLSGGAGPAFSSARRAPTVSRSARLPTPRRRSLAATASPASAFAAAT